jgi:hypothetical protein
MSSAKSHERVFLDPTYKLRPSDPPSLNRQKYLFNNLLGVIENPDILSVFVDPDYEFAEVWRIFLDFIGSVDTILEEPRPVPTKVLKCVCREALSLLSSAYSLLCKRFSPSLFETLKAFFYQVRSRAQGLKVPPPTTISPLVSVPFLEFPISVSITVFPVPEKPVLDIPILDITILVSPRHNIPILEVPDLFSISVTPIWNLPLWVCPVPFSITISPFTIPPPVLHMPCPWIILPPVPNLPAGGPGFVDLLPSTITSSYLIVSLLEDWITLLGVSNPPSSNCSCSQLGGPPSPTGAPTWPLGWPPTSPSGAPPWPLGWPPPAWVSSSFLCLVAALGSFPSIILNGCPWPPWPPWPPPWLYWSIYFQLPLFFFYLSLAFLFLAPALAFVWYHPLWFLPNVACGFLLFHYPFTFIAQFSRSSLSSDFGVWVLFWWFPWMVFSTSPFGCPLFWPLVPFASHVPCLSYLSPWWFPLFSPSSHLFMHNYLALPSSVGCGCLGVLFGSLELSGVDVVGCPFDVAVLLSTPVFLC